MTVPISVPEARLRVAYLVSYYPAVSHTFIEREVLGLRALGIDVHTISVRRCPKEDLRSQTMRDEALRTSVVLDGKLRRNLTEIMRVGVWKPASVAQLLVRALTAGQPSFRARLWQSFYLGEAASVFYRCRQLGIRHIHAHFANNAADIARLAVDLGRAVEGPDAGWRWSMTMHGSTEFEAVDRFDLPAKVRSAAGVACISDFTRSQLMRLVEPRHWSKLKVVRMSVDPDHYYPPGDGRVGRRGPMRVLHVGRQGPEKGLPILLEAIAAAADSDVPLEVRLVGHGPLTEQLERQAEALGIGQQVTFLGAVGQDDIPELYRWADVFCLPSFQEGLPVVLMEAMAAGLPVVATRIAGIPELVEDGVSGTLVTPGRADLVAAALERLYKEPQLRIQQGRRGREAVLNGFVIDQAALAQRDFLTALGPAAAMTGVGFRSGSHLGGGRLPTAAETPRRLPGAVYDGP